MLIRTGLAIAVTTLSISAGWAQSDVITQRKELMRTQGRTVGALSRMARGQDPFDQAKANEALDTLANTTSRTPTLFPINSKPTTKTGDYDASPKIWDNKADFDKRAADLNQIVTATKANLTADSLKDAVPKMGAACGGCHDAYRVRN